MRIYSNQFICSGTRLNLWKNWQTLYGENIYRVINTSGKNTIILRQPHTFSKPPTGFIANYVWQYPDEQIGVSPLDLELYDVYVSFTNTVIQQKSVLLPPGVHANDVLYVDFSKLTNYELV